jgi:hypothetical protein
MISRNIDVATHNDISTNKNGPLIGFLYDENKWEVFVGDKFTPKNKNSIT